MLLRYSFDRGADAELIERAVGAVLDAGVRTRDILQPGKRLVSTKEIGEAVLSELDSQARKAAPRQMAGA